METQGSGSKILKEAASTLSSTNLLAPSADLKSSESLKSLKTSDSLKSLKASVSLEAIPIKFTEQSEPILNYTTASSASAGLGSGLNRLSLGGAGNRGEVENLPQLVYNECLAYCEHLNNLLKPIKELESYCPLNPENLLDHLRDGVIFCHVLNMIRKNEVDMKSLQYNLDLTQLNQPYSKVIFNISANLTIFLNACKTFHIKTVNIGPEDIINKKQDLVLGLVWQIIRAHLLSYVNLISHPELIRLLKKDETMKSLLALTSEQVLIRWFNYHLEKAGSSDRLQNFSVDVCNSQKYIVLMKQIAPKLCNMELLDRAVASDDLEVRASLMLENAELLKCRKFVTAKDVATGHSRLNFAFAATLFNNYIGIRLPSEEEIEKLYDQIDELQESKLQLEKYIEEQKAEMGRMKVANETQIGELKVSFEEKMEQIESHMKEGRVESDQQVQEVTQKFETIMNDMKFEEEKKYAELKVTKDNEAALYKKELIEILKLTESCRGSISNLAPKFSAASDPRELSKAVYKFVQELVSESNKIDAKVTALNEQLDKKEKLNDIMGMKIKEFSEDLCRKPKNK